jgi:hypothetical protein
MKPLQLLIIVLSVLILWFAVQKRPTSIIVSDETNVLSTQPDEPVGFSDSRIGSSPEFASSFRTGFSGINSDLSDLIVGSQLTQPETLDTTLGPYRRSYFDNIYRIPRWFYSSYRLPYFRVPYNVRVY